MIFTTYNLAFVHVGSDIHNNWTTLTQHLVYTFGDRYLFSRAILLFRWYRKYLSKPAAEMKVPVASPFKRIFHTHSGSTATVQHKQALLSFDSLVSGIIFKIDSVDSHTLPRCDNTRLTDYQLSDLQTPHEYMFHCFQHKNAPQTSGWHVSIMPW